MNRYAHKTGRFHKKSMSIRAVISVILASVLSVSFLGCSPADDEQVTSLENVITQEIAQEDLIAQSKAMFGEDKYEYLPALENVSRDHVFELELGFDLEDRPELVNEFQVVGFYVDAEFSRPLNTDWILEKNDGSGYVATIRPPAYVPFGIPNEYTPPGGDTERISAAPQDEYELHKKEDFCDWGNAPRYYMVQWVDLATGESLERPIVQLFTIQTELPAPKSEMYVDDRGKLSVRWEPVDGAIGYMIAIENYLDSTGRTFDLFAADYLESTQTEWHAPKNLPFMTGDSQLERSYPDPPAGGSNVVKRDAYSKYLVVIAIGKYGHSAADKFHNIANISSHLPYLGASSIARSEGLLDSTNFTVGTLPSQFPVVMCDGNIVYKTIKYDYETAGIYSNVMVEGDGQNEDGSLINPHNVIYDVFKISYTLDKTNIFGTYTLFDPPENWQDELTKVRERQNALGRAGAEDLRGETIERIKNRAGEDGEGTGAEGEEGTEGTTNGGGGNIQVIDTEIFATSAMGNYLATNLLAGNAEISMRDFPEAFDTDHLLDVFFEVYYQNPLILGVDGLSMDDDMNLLVKYQDTGDERLRKQGEIQAKVAEITAQIITEDMTAVEKEIAINEYLCQTLEYDMAALESAAETNYKVIDPIYNDTFTAYGALMKGVCVCAGYAASFKLLANAAKLESVVITGTWAGGLGHAWNRVLLDGEWISVDSTNNDNPYMYNALFNLPDNVSSKVLIEDEQYMVDEMLGDYFATTDTNEYYKLMGDFFGNDQIVDRLVEGLVDDGKVTLRTDYDLESTGLESIIAQVGEKSGYDKLYYDSLLGVITISIAAA